MSFKTSLDIGCVDWGRASGGLITRPLTTAEIDAAIVLSGGRLFADGHASEPQLSAIAELMAARGGQDVRGFLGRESVVRHPLGYVRLALDRRSAAPVAAFLRLLHTEFGCGVYIWDNMPEPTRVLAWLEQLAWQEAEPRATGDGR